MAQYSPRAVVLTVVIFLFFFFPPTRTIPSAAQRDQVKALVSESWDALKTLNESNYGDFEPLENESLDPDIPSRGRWLNLTGFRQNDGYAWSTTLPAVRDRFRDKVRYAIGQDGLESLEAGRPNDLHAHYSNLTSWLRGKWIRSEAESTRTWQQAASINLTQVAPEISWSSLSNGIAASSSWERNVTGKEGVIWLRIDENDDRESRVGSKTLDEIHLARGVSAVLSLRDDRSSAGGWDFSLRGVHLLDSGTTFLTTGSAKFAGLYGLAHLSLSNATFDAIQREFNDTLPKAIRRKERELNKGMRDLDTQYETPKCELVVYLQQQPLSGFAPFEVQNLEHQIRFLDGPVHLSVPPIRVDMIMFSPDCGFVLESKGPPEFPPTTTSHVAGLPLAKYTSSIRQVLSVGVVLLAMQLWLLLQQMKVSSTPAKQSRISVKTIAMMTLGDGFLWISFMFAAPIVLELGQLLLAAAFAAFLGGSLFPMRLLMDVWTAQEPERAERIRHQQQEQRPAATAASTTPAASESNEMSRDDTDSTTIPMQTDTPRIDLRDTGASPLPVPVTANTPTTAPTTTTIRLISPSTSSFGTVYTRVMFLLLSVLFFTIHAFTSFTPGLLSIYSRFLSFVYLSLWVPQIVRNIQRNTSHALLPVFVGGQSLLRLVPLAYLWTVQDNVLFVEPDPYWVCTLAGWLWLQFCMVMAQEHLGPRFCVTQKGLAGKFWKRTGIEEAWDWHPVLREDEEGASLPVGVEPDGLGVTDDPSAKATTKGIVEDGTSHSGKQRAMTGKRTYECAICMQKMEVSVIPAGQSSPIGPGSVLDRRKYMVTPCRHIFHTACLEAWIGMRLQCPICRETLPPM